MIQRGKLIVIDGIDGAGKATQSARLIERLHAEGYHTATFDFPQYDQFFGRVVGRYLRNEFGPVQAISPYLSNFMYAADRWSRREAIEAALSTGKVVIMNRYVPSNLAFGAARLPPRQRAEFQAWTKQLEYEQFQIPREDLTIFLALSVATSQRLIRTKQARSYLNGRRRDANERDRTFMATVAREYERYCRTEPTARLVRCERAGQLLPIDQIHERIWTIVEPLVRR